MKHVTKIIMVCTGSLLLTTGITSPGASTQRLRKLFSKNSDTPQLTMTQEYTLSRPGGITVTNPYGSITIKKAWAQEKIAVSTITHTGSAQDMPLTRIDEQQLPNGDLKLSVVCANADKKTVVNLDLIVPEKRDLKLDTTLGAITIENIQAAISATTTQGPIQLTAVRGTIVATTVKSGSITIDKARGNIKATTDKGSINLYNTTESVVASTGKGSVNVTCQKLPSTGKLNVHTISGKISVKLPHEINADLVAKTKYGAVTCDHFVTIKPFTTQWNKNAWRHLKHEICGTLGTGEALISIQNDRGNIKIGKYA